MNLAPPLHFPPSHLKSLRLFAIKLCKRLNCSPQNNWRVLVLLNNVGVVVSGHNKRKQPISCLPLVRQWLYDRSVVAAERMGGSVVGLDTARPFTTARARDESLVDINLLSIPIRSATQLDGHTSLD
jgi:hypothetical protein